MDFWSTKRNEPRQRRGPCDVHARLRDGGRRARLLVRRSVRDQADALRPPAGQLRALVIGLNDYPKLPPVRWLKGAEPDATDIYGALDRGGVKDKLMLTKNVTRANVIKEMNALVDRSRAGDFVLIAYAGHGMQTPEYKAWKGLDPNGVNEQIALSNFDYKGDGAGEVIVNPEFRAWYARLDAKGVDTLVVIDSCFGGGMRSVDPRSGEMRVRSLAGSADAAERDKFAGMRMTDKEARTDVANLTHVTYLGGATRNSWCRRRRNSIPSRRKRLGVRSAITSPARSKEASRKMASSRAPICSSSSFRTCIATNGRQLVSIEPASDDPTTVGRTVFALPAENSTEPKPVPVPEPSPPGKRVDPIRVAIIDGPMSASATIEKGMAQDRRRGCLRRRHYLGRRKGGRAGRRRRHRPFGRRIDDRRNCRANLDAAPTPRSFPIACIAVGAGERRPRPDVRGVRDVRDRRPGKRICHGFQYRRRRHDSDGSTAGQSGHLPNPTDGRWTCRLRVVTPFGADTIVAVATSIRPTQLVAWLKAHRASATQPRCSTFSRRCSPSIHPPGWVLPEYSLNLRVIDAHKVAHGAWTTRSRPGRGVARVDVGERALDRERPAPSSPSFSCACG